MLPINTFLKIIMLHQPQNRKMFRNNTLNKVQIKQSFLVNFANQAHNKNLRMNLYFGKRNS